jgi:hypothetical protein
MASPRIPVSWLVLGCVVAVFAFFTYHILHASATEEASRAIQESLAAKGSVEYPRPAAAVALPPLRPAAQEEAGDMYETQEAPAVQHPPAAARPLPHVAGQTEEDLRAHEPLQTAPPPTQYDAPDAVDPLNRTAFMSSEFGSNLRHPEQLFEARPGMTLGGAVESGTAGVYSSPGGHRAVGYSPEHLQNGGMTQDGGILAFDSSMEGGAYSML